MQRRHFLSIAAAASVTAAEPPRPLRAAVIGHTGRGDFGHGLEKIFAGREGVTLVALADADAAGRAKKAAELNLQNTYADWRAMLEKEKPDLVSVAMRHSDQHRDIITACVRAGAHVYAEKPLCRTPQEGDEILAAAKAAGRRVAVAHTQRTALHIRRLRDAVLQDGIIGELKEMKAWGKQDHRAGGEDLMVLGTHIMDLLRMFAGDPLWCSARVLQGGRDITKADARLVKDNVGPVAGDEVFAHFAFGRGVNATFTSTAALKDTVGAWGIEFTGSKGMARINCEIAPNAFLRTAGVWTTAGQDSKWQPFAPATVKAPDAHPLDPVGDWLAAVRENREPVLSAANAAWAVEMVCSVYQSALTGARALFPLTVRSHPLE